jgi:uncharacterized protein
MKNIDGIRKIINLHRSELEEKYKVKNIAIFGSFTRGEQTEESDIDIIVDFTEPIGLLFIHLSNYLENILGITVDLIALDGIKTNRKNYIMKSLIYV